MTPKIGFWDRYPKIRAYAVDLTDQRVPHEEIRQRIGERFGEGRIPSVTMITRLRMGLANGRWSRNGHRRRKKRVPISCAARRNRETRTATQPAPKPVQEPETKSAPTPAARPTQQSEQQPERKTTGDDVRKQAAGQVPLELRQYGLVYRGGGEPRPVKLPEAVTVLLCGAPVECRIPGMIRLSGVGCLKRQLKWQRTYRAGLEIAGYRRHGNAAYLPCRDGPCPHWLSDEDYRLMRTLLKQGWAIEPI